MKSFSELGIKPDLKKFIGEKIGIKKVLDKEIILHDFDIGPSKYPEKGNGKCLKLQITFKDELRIIFTGSTILMNIIEKINQSDLPITTTIIESNDHYEFN
jgi:hypothetical protein